MTSEIFFEEYELKVFSPSDPRNSTILGTYKTLAEAEMKVREYTPDALGLSAEHFLAANIIPTPFDDSESLRHIPPLLRARLRTPTLKPSQSYVITRTEESLPAYCSLLQISLEEISPSGIVVEWRKNQPHPCIYPYRRSERDWSETLTAILVEKESAIKLSSLLCKQYGGIILPLGSPKIMTETLKKKIRTICNKDIEDDVSDFLHSEQYIGWRKIGWKGSTLTVSKGSFQ